MQLVVKLALILAGQLAVELVEVRVLGQIRLNRAHLLLVQRARLLQFRPDLLLQFLPDLILQFLPNLLLLAHLLMFMI